MPSFSKSSEAKLSTCHFNLRLVMSIVIDFFDFTILSGHRTEEEQKKLVEEGKSKTMNSKHLESPSLAIDIAPYPINWNDTSRFIYLAGIVMGTAELLKIKIRWGGDWDRDTELRDNRFNDLCHFELVE